MGAKDYVLEAQGAISYLNSANIQAYDKESAQKAELAIAETIRQLRDIKRRCNDEQRSQASKNSRRNSAFGGKRSGVLGAMNQAAKAGSRDKIEQYRKAKSAIDGLISQLQGKKSEMKALKSRLRANSSPNSQRQSNERHVNHLQPPAKPSNARNRSTSSDQQPQNSEAIALVAVTQTLSLRLRPLQLTVTDISAVSLMSDGSTANQHFQFRMNQFENIRAAVQIFRGRGGDINSAYHFASQVIQRTSLNPAGGFVYGIIPTTITEPAALVPVWNETLHAANAEIYAVLSGA